MDFDQELQEYLAKVEAFEGDPSGLDFLKSQRLDPKRFSSACKAWKNHIAQLEGQKKTEYESQWAAQSQGRTEYFRELEEAEYQQAFGTSSSATQLPSYAGAKGKSVRIPAKATAKPRLQERSMSASRMSADEPLEGDMADIESIAMSVGEDEIEPNNLQAQLLLNERTRVVHRIPQDCTWVFDDNCVICKFKEYQRGCIQALKENALTFAEVADLLAVIGVYVPQRRTARMVDVFTDTMLDLIVEEIEVKNRLPESSLSATEDHAVMEAVRARQRDQGANILTHLMAMAPDRMTLFDNLIKGLPVIAKTAATESSFTVDCVNTAMKGLFLDKKKHFNLEFSDTSPELEKRLGRRSLHPDFVVHVRDKTVLFGETAGPTGASSTAKVGWDLYKLAHFGKQLVDTGEVIALLLQVIYNEGTYMRLTTPASGMYLLSSVGILAIPLEIADVPDFAATIPVAEAMMTNLSGFLKEKKRVVPQGTPNTSKRFAPGSSGQHQGQRGPHQGPSGSQQGLWGSSRGSSGQQQGLRGSHQSPSGPKQSTSGPHLGTGGPHQSAQS
ncbi:MAG: hypothetical protein J3Q66DRAFT_423043 [Benniella sp.]|nr:MAG: hypothetical protein J3Q66DRAFT_423043 [Benniella sp.]